MFFCYIQVFFEVGLYMISRGFDDRNWIKSAIIPSLHAKTQHLIVYNKWLSSAPATCRKYLLVTISSELCADAKMQSPRIVL